MPSARKPSRSNAATKKADPANVAANGAAYAAAWLRGWVTVAEEANRFAARRLEHNVAVARALAGCATPADAWSAWTEAAQTLAQDYVEEALRLGQTCAEAAAVAQDEIAAAAEAAKPDAAAEAPASAK